MHSFKNLCQRIANRGNFCSLVLADLQGFVPYRSTPDADSLRKFLKLDIGDTDYYVLGMAAALVANYDLLVLMEEPIRMTDIALALTMLPTNRGIRSTDPGVTVIAGSSDPLGMIRTTTTWPVSHVIQLRRIDADYAEFGTAGTATRVRAFLAGDILKVTWPADTSLTAHIQLTNPGAQWGAGAVLTFVDDPESYPYAEMLRALEPSSHWLKLLNRFGIAAHYAGAVGQAITRTGLLAAALVLDTKSK